MPSSAFQYTVKGLPKTNTLNIIYQLGILYFHVLLTNAAPAFFITKTRRSCIGLVIRVAFHLLWEKKDNSKRHRFGAKEMEKNQRRAKCNCRRVLGLRYRPTEQCTNWSLITSDLDLRAMTLINYADLVPED